MNYFRIVAATGSVISLGLLLFWTQSQISKEANLKVKALEVNAQLARRLAVLENELNKTKSELYLERQNSATTQNTQPSRASGDKAKPESSPRGLINHAELYAKLKDPDFVQYLKAKEIQNLGNHYFKLFKQLNLPSEKLNTFLELSAEKKLSNLYAASASSNEDRPGMDPDAVAVARQSVQDLDKKIADLLGADAASQIQAFDDNSGARAFERELKHRTALAGEPLAPAQLESLAALNGGLKGGQDDPKVKLDEGIRKILSPTQTKEYDKMMADLQARDVVATKMKKSFK
jgi:hypothetical protein